VEGGQGDDLLDALDDRLIHQDGGGEALPPVDNPVSRRAQLVQVLHRPHPRIQQPVQDQPDRDPVVGDLRLGRDRIHPGADVLDPRAGNADPLDQPLRQDRLVGHVEELVLQGRTAAVENQDLHRTTSLDLDPFGG
jgi:hypothetical protein